MIKHLGDASGFAGAWFYILCEDAIGELWVISGHKNRNVGEWYDAVWIPPAARDNPQRFIDTYPEKIYRMEVTKEFLIAHGIKV